METKIDNKKPIKNSFLLEKEKNDILKDFKDFDDIEKEYLTRLFTRLIKARNARNTSHQEFDYLTYTGYLEANERGANTTISAKKNKGETNFQSGTLRTKMFSFLSSFVGLNLEPDISAFNENEVLINSLGNGMETIIAKTEELENDDEWKMIRQYELLKHGFVFVEDLWQEKLSLKKEITSGFYGQIKGVKWNVKQEKQMGRPARAIIDPTCVYLGDLSKYMIEDQPCIFTVSRKSRNEAEKIYKGWERWDIAKSKQSDFTNENSVVSADNKKDTVEIIKYQDKPNNEFQILINKVPMLPMGFPLTEVNPTGDYTICQQNLEPIKHNFAYGKSFIFKNKNIVAILDQMMKLAVLKTQKSYMPPYLNLGERVLSNKIFMPGQISRGVRPQDIVPVDENETKGVTNSEFGMIQQTIDFIDRNTSSQTFGGMKEQGQVTATQILELQRQAKVMIGLLVLSASLLEKKLSIKRLMILLNKWFEPVNNVLDKTRNTLINKYRIVSKEGSVEDEGQGINMVIPAEGVDDEMKAMGEEKFSEDLMEVEDTFKKTTGKPTRITMLDPKMLRKAKITWLVTVVAKEEKSSEASKLLFGAMIRDAVELGLRLNPDYIEQRFAQVWQEDPSKMFMKEEQQAPQEGQGLPGGNAPGGGSPGVQTPKITPQVKMPIGDQGLINK